MFSILLTVESTPNIIHCRKDTFHFPFHSQTGTPSALTAQAGKVRLEGHHTVQEMRRRHAGEGMGMSVSWRCIHHAHMGCDRSSTYICLPLYATPLSCLSLQTCVATEHAHLHTRDMLGYMHHIATKEASLVIEVRCVLLTLATTHTTARVRKKSEIVRGAVQRSERRDQDPPGRQACEAVFMLGVAGV